MSIVPANSTPVSTSIVLSEAAELQKTRWELAQREATALAKSSWTPKHLIGRNDQETIATCIGVVTMAEKWRMSAQMVAGETYSVHGKVGFQGKLYAALAVAHGGLVDGLQVIYDGSGDKMAAVVYGSSHKLTEADKQLLRDYVSTGKAATATDLQLSGVKAIRLVLGQVKSDNKMWVSDPEQKLFYSGATKWCRRFMPDLVLGAVSVEDLERIEYSDRQPVSGQPRTEVLADRLAGMIEDSEPELVGGLT
jgi:hypothetical protein